jgi:GNAT superfamily N-acetyltransferase
MKARLVTAADYPACLALVREAHAEGRDARYELDEQKVRELFDRSLRGTDYFCIVADDDGIIVGLTYGLVTEHFYSVMRYATNVMFYVTPSRRGSWASVRMLRLFEREAQRRDADEMLIGNSSGVEAARTVELFYALGFQPVGANCVKYFGG